jgi:hypothetical protein
VKDWLTMISLCAHYKCFDLILLQDEIKDCSEYRDCLAAIIAIYIDVIIAIGEMLVCALEVNRTEVGRKE